jgi:hypothetical protein
MGKHRISPYVNPISINRPVPGRKGEPAASDSFRKVIR